MQRISVFLMGFRTLFPPLQAPAAIPSSTVTASLSAGAVPAGPAPSLGGFLLSSPAERCWGCSAPAAASPDLSLVTAAGAEPPGFDPSLIPEL